MNYFSIPAIELSLTNLVYNEFPLWAFCPALPKMIHWTWTQGLHLLSPSFQHTWTKNTYKKWIWGPNTPHCLGVRELWEARTGLWNTGLGIEWMKHLLSCYHLQGSLDNHRWPLKEQPQESYHFWQFLYFINYLVAAVLVISSKF